MRAETLEEVVNVRAGFASGEITPLAFKRKGRIHRVDKINAHWADKEGQQTIYYFSVESSGNIYEFSLRTQDMLWRLERVVLEE